MKPQNITLISFGYFGKNYLEDIFNEVQQEFSIPVITREGHFDVSEFLDTARKQYNGDKLLREIQFRFSTKNGKTLGIFNVDLYIPILTFIFGQAFLNGCCGIASAYRLSNERYGIKPDEKVLIDRLRKEVIHELGHTFGLVHCINPVCVMRSSTYVEDIDQKSWKFCSKCRKEIEQNKG